MKTINQRDERGLAVREPRRKGNRGGTIYQALLMTAASGVMSDREPHYSLRGELTADGIRRLYELAIGLRQFEGGTVRLEVRVMGGRREGLVSEVRRKLLPLASHGIAVEVLA
jgi:hypothetical protein